MTTHWYVPPHSSLSFLPVVPIQQRARALVVHSLPAALAERTHRKLTGGCPGSTPPVRLFPSSRFHEPAPRLSVVSSNSEAFGARSLCALPLLGRLRSMQMAWDEDVDGFGSLAVPQSVLATLPKSITLNASAARQPPYTMHVVGEELPDPEVSKFRIGRSASVFVLVGRRRGHFVVGLLSRQRRVRVLSERGPEWPRNAV